MLIVGPLLAALVVAAAVAASQPPSPSKPSHSRGEQTQTGKPAQPASANQRGTEESPLFVKVVQPEPAADHPQSASSQSKEKPAEDKTLDYVLAAITTIATAVIAAFTITLARSTDKLWKEAISAGETAKVAANAAQSSAEAAKLQSTALIAGERAYLGVTRIAFFARSRLTKGRENFHRARAEITIVNAGRTMATKVKLSLALNVGSNEQAQQVREGETYLLPGVPWNVQHVSKHEIGSEQLRQLITHKERLVLRGKIVYDTVFEKGCFSEFVFRHGLRHESGFGWDGEIFEDSNKAS